MAQRDWKAKAGSILEEAKNLLGKVASRRARTSDSAAAVDVRVEVIGSRLSQLEQDADASFEVVRAVAQQHSSLTEQLLQLAQALEETDAKVQRLTWTCIALAALAAASLAVALLR